MKHHAHISLAALRGRSGEDGYILAIVMLVLMVVAMLSATLLSVILANQQHVARDKAFTQSLPVAEAGLNQYLWMVASGKSNDANNFAILGNESAPDPHFLQTDLLDPYTDATVGSYAIKVTPPTSTDSRLEVTVTGQANSPTEVPRTVTAHLGRPSFSEYVLLVNDSVYIGGPIDRVWHGKTHSNTGIRIDTANITDLITCSQPSFDDGSSWHAGIYSGSGFVPHDNSPTSSTTKWWPLWDNWWNTPNKQPPQSPTNLGTLLHAPAQPIDFNTVLSDFVKLNGLATGSGVNLPYSTTTGHTTDKGWYIKLLPNKLYHVYQVTGETLSSTGTGGSLTYLPTSTLVPNTDLPYPTKGVIYSNDNVWIDGTGVAGRITIAASTQLVTTPSSAKNNYASVNIINDLTYSAYDGTVAIGLIAQQDIRIPTYAPYPKSTSIAMGQNNSPYDPGTIDMRIDGAFIAQTGHEYVQAVDQGGPLRRKLTIFGSVSSFGTPYRADASIPPHDGFAQGENTYDDFLLHNPPPYFPVVGTYQILDWTELPSTGALPLG